MKALFEKDLRLVLVRKSTLAIFLIIGIVFTWSFSSSASGAYMTILGTMLALSTISYDDSDNCMAFLFTLPCTRKQYVYEKYLFVYGFSFIAGMMALVIIGIAGLIQGNPLDGVAVAEILASEIPILVITGGLMIPLQLKFGPEKARIVLMAVIGTIVVIGYLLSQVDGVGRLVYDAANVLDHASPMVLLPAFLLILLALTGISVFITGKIMDGEEY